MAKKYRVKDKNGKDKVNVVFADYDMAGRQKYRADDYLKGLTPEQHCKQMIAKRGEGKFEHESATYDHCLLPVYSPYGGGKYLARVISYEYATCEEIELTFKLNGKTVTEKELAKLKGGDNVVITANQEVTWTLLGNNKLEKLVQGKASYSFTMPKTGKFNIKATGKCDPSASKSVAVQVATKPVIDKKLAHALSFSGGLISGMNDIQTRAYAANVAETESAGTFNQKIENKFGYMGLYQFGASALADIGLINKKKYDDAVKKYGNKLANGSDPEIHKSFLRDANNWNSGYNKDKFLNDRSLQDKSFTQLTNNNLKYASTDAKKIISNNAEKTAAYLKMAHLKGPNNASKGIVNPKYDVTDGNKTSMQKYGQGAANDLAKYTKIVQDAMNKKGK